MYDTDTDDESGPWGPWKSKDPECSRTCGGGVHTETRVCKVNFIFVFSSCPIIFTKIGFRIPVVRDPQSVTLLATVSHAGVARQIIDWSNAQSLTVSCLKEDITNGYPI